jgi:hypothetical protein
MKPYRPSGKIPLPGFGYLFLAAMVGAPIIGIVYQLLVEVFLVKVFANLSEFIPDLIAAFLPGFDFIARLPVINEIIVVVTALFVIAVVFSVVTCAVFILLYTAINIGKVRNPLLGFVFGILVGLIAQVSNYYVSYSFFQNHSRDQRYESLRQPNSDRKILPIQPEETSFVKYLQYKLGSDKAFWPKFMLGLLWLQIFAWGSVSSAVNEPFCEESNDWYQKEKIIGTVHPAFNKEFVMLIVQEDFVRAGLLLDATTNEPTETCLAVYARHSLSESARMVYLTLKDVRRTSKRNEKLSVNTEDLISGCVSPGGYQQLSLGSAAKTVLASDQFSPHRLQNSSVENMLSKLNTGYAEVQAIYLVDKILPNQANLTLHVLGVVVDRSIVSTDDQKNEIKNSLVRLTQKIENFGAVTIVILNDDLEVLESIRAIAGAPIYHK